MLLSAIHPQGTHARTHAHTDARPRSLVRKAGGEAALGESDGSAFPVGDVRPPWASPGRGKNEHAGQVSSCSLTQHPGVATAASLIGPPGPGSPWIFLARKENPTALAPPEVARHTSRWLLHGEVPRPLPKPPRGAEADTAVLRACVRPQPRHGPPPGV